MKKLYFKDFTAPLIAHVMLEVNDWLSTNAVVVINVETIPSLSIQLVGSEQIRVWYNILK